MENIKLLIQTLTGYEVNEHDLPILNYLKNSETQKVLNDTHLTALPNELVYVVEYRTASAFLLAKKETILGDEAFDVVKSVKEGDTTVDIGGTTKEERFNMLINWLMDLGKRDVLCFRRLKW